MHSAHSISVLQRVAPAIVAIASFAAAACVGSTPPLPPPAVADTVCARGALAVGGSKTGSFNILNGCRTLDIVTGETSYAHSYSVSLTPGQGYLATMYTTDVGYYYMKSALELIGKHAAVQDTSKDSVLAYDSYYWPYWTTLAFVADSTKVTSIRTATADSQSVDTGSYIVSLTSCKAPLVNVVDSATHPDTLKATDCLMPVGNFNVLDSSRVQLYSVHFDANTARTITWSANRPMAVVVGPTYDTYAELAGSLGSTSYGISTGSLEFAAPRTGTYTIIFGTYGFSTAPVPYTIGIGGEHTPTASVATLFSRSRSRPLVGPRR